MGIKETTKSIERAMRSYWATFESLAEIFYRLPLGLKLLFSSIVFAFTAYIAAVVVLAIAIMDLK